MVSHVEPFNPVVTEMIILLNGEKVIAVEAVRYSPYDGKITNTGVIFDLMIHDIDIVCNAVCTVEIDAVCSFGSVVRSEMTDFANA